MPHAQPQQRCSGHIQWWQLLSTSKQGTGTLPSLSLCKAALEQNHLVHQTLSLHRHTTANCSVAAKALLQQVVGGNLLILITCQVRLYASITLKAQALQPLNRGGIRLCELDLQAAAGCKAAARHRERML